MPWGRHAVSAAAGLAAAVLSINLAVGPSIWIGILGGGLLLLSVVLGLLALYDARGW